MTLAGSANAANIAVTSKVCRNGLLVALMVFLPEGADG